LAPEQSSQNVPVVVSDPREGTPEASTRLEQLRWFEAEVHPHAASVRAYLRGSYPGVGEVDDLLQESFLRIWKARATRTIDSPRAFLFQIARRLAIDLLRRRKTARIEPVCDLAELPVLEDRPDAADAACRSEELWLLARALHALPTRCREVMILRKIEGLSQKEIAVRLGISEGTVQVQVGRGLRHLEEFFFQLDQVGSREP
jgi:RNA polymerase sigma-70 factor (ECF subfamily)